MSEEESNENCEGVHFTVFLYGQIVNWLRGDGKVGDFFRLLYTDLPLTYYQLGLKLRYFSDGVYGMYFWQYV